MTYDETRDLLTCLGYPEPAARDALKRSVRAGRAGTAIRYGARLSYHPQEHVWRIHPGHPGAGETA